MSELPTRAPAVERRAGTTPGGLRRAFSEGVGLALVYLAYRGAAALAERMPIGLGDALARFAGLVVLRVAKGERETVRRNLRRVVGDGPRLDAVVREAFLSYAHYWLETFRLGRYSREELLDLVECQDMERLEALLGGGRGSIVISAHFGFYDLGVAWLGARGHRFTTVAQVLRPRALFEWFASRRERLGAGIRVLPSSPGGAARDALLEEVERGGNVILLAERDLGRRGVQVALFGEETTIPYGPPLLAARTGAPLLAGAIYMKERASSVGGPSRKRFVIEVEELAYERSGDEQADVAAVAALVVGAVERIVLKAPEQWHLFSTNWPSDEPHLPPRQPRLSVKNGTATAPSLERQSAATS